MNHFEKEKRWMLEHGSLLGYVNPVRNDVALTPPFM
jgi:hypothetical protein